MGDTAVTKETANYYFQEIWWCAERLRSAVSLLAGEIGALRFKAPPGFMTRKPVIKP